jgi:hypothetical protein
MNHHIKITLPCISLRHITRNFVTSKFMHFFCLLGIYLSFSLHSSLQTIVLNYKVLKLNIHSFSRFIASFTISMPPFIYFNSIQIFPKKNSIEISSKKNSISKFMFDTKWLYKYHFSSKYCQAQFSFYYHQQHRLPITYIQFLAGLRAKQPKQGL